MITTAHYTIQGLGRANLCIVSNICIYVCIYVTQNFCKLTLQVKIGLTDLNVMNIVKVEFPSLPSLSLKNKIKIISEEFIQGSKVGNLGSPRALMTLHGINDIKKRLAGFYRFLLLTSNIFLALHRLSLSLWHIKKIGLKKEKILFLPKNFAYLMVIADPFFNHFGRITTCLYLN